MIVAVAACAGPGGGTAATTAPPAPQASVVPSVAASPSVVGSPAADPLAAPTIDGSFAVADGRTLALRCWGEGDPTIVLVGGHPSSGIADFEVSPGFLRPLAEQTRTCAYARSGYAGSDPPPNEPRDADDVIGDLHDLLGSAGIDGPVVLAGASFGGFIVAYYAARHPEDVSAVVMLDAPVPSATLSLDEIPEIAWDHPENPERTDTIAEFEHRFARERLPIEAPLRIVTATRGFDTEEQDLWLDISPSADQVRLQGGHDIHVDDPAGSAAEILEMVDAAT
jgi:pimeloyl-ACP methyl ester carboxylesterase